MGKNDFTPGSSTIEGFHHWIRERHRIYLLRKMGFPPPWTADPILKEYKFTNVFRQLDKGTVFLVKNVREHVAFNIIMYRMINRVETFEDVGFVGSWETVKARLKARSRRGEKVFTSAHMTVGRAYEDKIDTTCETLTGVWNDLRGFWRPWDHDTMQECFEDLLDHRVYGIGKFIAYEIVCDFRWMIREYSDRMTWASVGPGARRGMIRLGLDPGANIGPGLQRGIDSMRTLLEEFPIEGAELREVEHSLCEFDKYERVRNGEGRPKERYDYSQWVPQ